MEEQGFNKCIICGEKTNQVATVYLGHENRSKGGRVSMSYKQLDKPICEKCAYERHVKEPLRWLFPFVLQLGWFELVRAGHSPSGYMSMLFALYGLYRLIINSGELLWRKLKPNEKAPSWLAGQETIADLASECLKHHLKGNYTGTSEHLETIREYERAHPKHAGR